MSLQLLGIEADYAIGGLIVGNDSFFGLPSEVISEQQRPFAFAYVCAVRLAFEPIAVEAAAVAEQKESGAAHFACSPL